MKMAFQVNGREMIFSEKELTSILEEHFSSKTQHNKTIEVLQKPTEGIAFEVKPQTIDQTLFKNKRVGYRQEATRQIIVEAFEEIKKNPEKYGKNFKTLIPKNDWNCKRVIELIQLSTELGGHIADWVEQALEWAQRISNGETWVDICDKPDTAQWYRLVIWKDKYCRLIGNSYCSYKDKAVSYVDGHYYTALEILTNAVPLVVL